MLPCTNIWALLERWDVWEPLERPAQVKAICLRSLVMLSAGLTARQNTSEAQQASELLHE